MESTGLVRLEQQGVLERNVGRWIDYDREAVGRGGRDEQEKEQEDSHRGSLRVVTAHRARGISRNGSCIKKRLTRSEPSPIVGPIGKERWVVLMTGDNYYNDRFNWHPRLSPTLHNL